MLRTHKKPTMRPDNIYMAVSDDDGNTFGPPKRLNIWGYPAQLINLADNRVLMTYGFRKGTQGVRGCISEDGVSWDIKNEFVISLGGDGPRSEPEYWHTGYPYSAQLADGSIVTGHHVFSQADPPVQYVVATRFGLPY